jgi:hypothetical protein
MVIKDILQCTGFESQIRSRDSKNIVNGSGTHGEITMDDISDFMSLLAANSAEGDKEWAVITGEGGYLRMMLRLAFEKYGHSKLPRKLKKRMFMTKKIRKDFLPEYYLT